MNILLITSNSTAQFNLNTIHVVCGYMCVPVCLSLVNLQNSSCTCTLTSKFLACTFLLVNTCDTPEMHYIVTSKIMHKM